MAPRETTTTDSEAGDIRRLCREILSYLTRNPRARDTLEGIVEWWFLEQDIRRQTARVERALARLVNDGRVLEERGPDGRFHYRVAPRKLDGGGC